MSAALLDPNVLAGLANLELVARTVVEGFLTGLHRSVQHGFSVEFADYRAYSPGDDPRFIDWNGYARTERTYIKRHRGETNTSLVLILDASASMGFRSGGVSKFECARFLVAALAFLARRQHDPFGWIIFDREIRDLRAPSSRVGQLPAWLATLESFEPARRTDIETVLECAHAAIRRRGLVAVVSDFYHDPELLLERVRPLAYRGQDLMLFHVLDEAERAPSVRRPERLVDVETGESRIVDVDRGYAERVSEHAARLRAGALEIGADYVELDTSAPLDAALRAYLAFRRRRP